MNGDGDGGSTALRAAGRWARTWTIDRVAACGAWATAGLVLLLVVLDMSLERQRCVSDGVATIVLAVACLLHTMWLASLQFTELMKKNYAGMCRAAINMVTTAGALVIQPLRMAMSLVWPSWAVATAFDARVLFAQAALYACIAAVVLGAVADVVLTQVFTGVACIGLPVANMASAGALIAVGINYWRTPRRAPIYGASSLPVRHEDGVDLLQADEAQDYGQ